MKTSLIQFIFFFINNKYFEAISSCSEFPVNEYLVVLEIIYMFVMSPFISFKSAFLEFHKLTPIYFNIKNKIEIEINTLFTDRSDWL